MVAAQTKRLVQATVQTIRTAFRYQSFLNKIRANCLRLPQTALQSNRIMLSWSCLIRCHPIPSSMFSMTIAVIYLIINIAAVRSSSSQKLLMLLGLFKPLRIRRTILPNRSSGLSSQRTKKHQHCLQLLAITLLQILAKVRKTTKPTKWWVAILNLRNLQSPALKRLTSSTMVF